MRIHLFSTALLALTLATAAGADELVSFDGLAGSKPAAPIAAVVRKPAPATGWTFVDEGATNLTRGSLFDPKVDAPSFRNFASRPFYPLTTAPSHGTCYGINYLAMTWYQQIVLPVFENVLDSKFELRGRLGVAGPIRFDNLASYRLRAYTGSKRRQSELERKALTFHMDQALLNPFSEGDPEAVFRGLLAELSDRRTQLSMVSIRSADGKAGHSLLVYRVESGTARASNGQTAPACRVSFFDPNFPAASDAGGNDTYFLYFPKSKAWACNPSWLARYSSAGFTWQARAALAKGQLKLDRVNPEAARWTRDLFNAWQGANGWHANEPILAE